MLTRGQLVDRVCVMLAGRAAEELALGDTSTGAQNDLERATETARQMVCRFGMSQKLGPLAYGQPQGLRFLELPVNMADQRNFSEETAQAIDQEVRALVEAEYLRARAVLSEKRGALAAIAARLLVIETIDRMELEQLAAAATSRGQAQTSEDPTEGALLAPI